METQFRKFTKTTCSNRFFATVPEHMNNTVVLAYQLKASDNFIPLGCPEQGRWAAIVEVVE